MSTKYEDLQDMLKHELDTLIKKGDINKDSLDSINKLLKSMHTLKELEGSEQKQGGYSNAYSYMPMGGMQSNAMRGASMRGSYEYSRDGMSNDYSREGMSNNYSRNSYEGTGNSNDGRRGRDADSDGRYSEDNSFRRGRDARGRYTSRDGGYTYDGNYSRHSAKDRVIQRLEMMMDESQSTSERDAIRKCIDELQG